MNSTVQHFCELFWISLLVTAFLFLWAFVVVCRNHLWRRWRASERAFLIRLGLPRKFVEYGAQFCDSKKFAFVIGFAIVVWIPLIFLNAWSYFHFKHRLRPEPPTEAKKFYDIGANCNKSNNYSAAISNFDRAIEVYSNYDVAYAARAFSKYQLNDFQGAITDADKSIALYPYSNWPYGTRGYAEYFLTNYPAALADFNQAIKLYSDDARIFNQRGVTEMRLTDFPAAIADFNKAIKLHTNYMMAYYNRGTVQQGLTNYAAAIADLDAAIKINSKYADAFNRRGLCKWYLKDYNGAIVDCTEAIKLDSKFSAAYNNRGLAKKGLQQYPESIPDFNKSIELDRNSSFAYFNRADAEHHVRDFIGAVADFKKAIELNPKDATAYCGLAGVQNDLFQFQPALENFRKSQQLGSPMEDPWIRIWMIRSRLGEKSQATAELQTHLETMKDSKSSWLGIIELYFVGQYSEKDFLNCANSSTPKWQNEWRCCANYYVGMKRLINGESLVAANYFQKSIETWETNHIEYISAEVELKALNKQLRQ